MKNRRGDILVISGLSGAGKSTLGEALCHWVEEQGSHVKLLDGDSLREFFEGALLYSSADRLLVSQIIAYSASLLAEQGINVILATMLSQPGAREFLQSKVDFHEIFLDADLTAVAQADKKGVYRGAGLYSSEVVGRELDFIRPSAPDLVLHTHRESPEESLAKVQEFIRNNRLFGV